MSIEQFIFVPSIPLTPEQIAAQRKPIRDLVKTK